MKNPNKKADAEGHEISAVGGDDDEVSEVSYSDNQRDEVKELEEFFKSENRLVGVWRALTGMALLITGVVITITTHKFLREEQTKNFEQAVRVASVY